MSTPQLPSEEAPPRFIVAQEIIDNTPGADALRRGLDTLDLAEQLPFMTWRRKRSRILREKKLMEEQGNTPRLTADEYTKALKSNQFHDPDSVAAFVKLSRGLEYGPRAEPVYIGDQDDKQYFLQPQYFERFTVEDIPKVAFEDSAFQPDILRFRKEDGTRPIIDCGLHLGMLGFTSKDRHASTHDIEPKSLRRTPFHLFLQPMDSPESGTDAFSVWLIIDQGPFDEFEFGFFKASEADQNNTWWACGLSTGDRPFWDCLQLFTGKEVLAAPTGLGNRSRGLFDHSISRGTELIQRLKAWHATYQEVVDARRAAAPPD